MRTIRARRRSDHLELVLVRGDETRRYLIASGAPGLFQAHATPAAGALPERLAGGWQEDGSGYRVELRIPDSPRPDRIGIGVYDSAEPAETHADPRALLAYDARAANALAALAPDHARARVASADGWLIADAGALEKPGATQPETQGFLGRLIYQSLIAPTLAGSPALDGVASRLDATEVWQALSGVAATSWRAADAGGDVVLTAAVPMRISGEVRGALVLEQANRALPLLANRALFGLAGATLAALAIAGLILLLFGASLSFRIRRLRNAAERAVRTSGRLSGPMPLADADDELGDLARSFAKLFDEVGAYTDYLRTLASKLSHELNTPLAIVKSSLDNLDHQALPADARAYAARARDGAERLGKIVRAMSEAGRIERAIAAAEAEDFDLAVLVAGCAAGYRAAARHTRVASAHAVGAGAVPRRARADRAGARQARRQRAIVCAGQRLDRDRARRSRRRRRDPRREFRSAAAGNDAGSAVRFAGQHARQHGARRRRDAASWPWPLRRASRRRAASRLRRGAESCGRARRRIPPEARPACRGGDCPRDPADA